MSRAEFTSTLSNFCFLSKEDKEQAKINTHIKFFRSISILKNLSEAHLKVILYNSIVQNYTK